MGNDAVSKQGGTKTNPTLVLPAKDKFTLTVSWSRQLDVSADARQLATVERKMTITYKFKAAKSISKGFQALIKAEGTQVNANFLTAWKAKAETDGCAGDAFCVDKGSTSGITVAATSTTSSSTGSAGGVAVGAVLLSLFSLSFM